MNSKSKGDQYIRIVVNIPKKLSKHQKNLLDEFQKSDD
jgi:molecular chaperone DnaJ